MSQKPCDKTGDSKVTAKRIRPFSAAVRVQPRDTFQVVVQCADEEEQEQLYDEFRSRNLTVRLLTM